MVRKIAVVTGSRAEYGLLFRLMEEIRDDPGLELQLMVTGMHLSPEFGSTREQIEKDGFSITACIETLLSSDTPSGIAKSIGLGVMGFSDAFEKRRPDLLVLLGDRYEAFAAAQAAMTARIPIAHIHGGEATEGCIDEAIRHALTKMAHLHFVAAEPYRQRVIQLGEDPGRVFNFGAPGLDRLHEVPRMTRSELEHALDFSLGEMCFLVTCHPVTLQDSAPEDMVRQLCRALDRFPGVHIIFTKQNADAGGRAIGAFLEDYAARHPDRMKVFTNLGRVRYLNAIRHVDLVIGNSSSGLIEAPVLKKATVNIGDRQRGRLKASSVIDCPDNARAIAGSIREALSPEIQKSLIHTVSCYGTGGASRCIKETLKEQDLCGLLVKKFHDLPV